MSEKLQGYLVNVLCALVIFGSGYYLHGVINRNSFTTVVGKTIEFMLPGRRDTVVQYVKIRQDRTSDDSTKYWRGKYDSIRTAGPVGDTSTQADPLFTGHLLPFKVIIRDDWTRNHLTVYPLNTDSDRVRLDWTEYDTLRFTQTIQDTTMNVIRVDQSWYDHWEIGAGGMAVLIWLASQL